MNKLLEKKRCIGETLTCGGNVSFTRDFHPTSREYLYTWNVLTAVGVKTSVVCKEAVLM